MFEAMEIKLGHKDIVHDITYNWYGDRMATCSSDQYVKVLDKKENSEEWIETACFKAHSASVFKVQWAHPEFGQVLATCSYDRTVAVWEETFEGSRKKSKTHWLRRANLVDSRASVTDVKFAPKSQGLQLATCSSEGIIRIYEAPDFLNLSQWTVIHEINARAGLSCISWSPSIRRTHPPMLAVGSDDPNLSTSGKVILYEYNENYRKWNKLETIHSVTDAVHDIEFAPNLGRSYHILGVANDKDIRLISLTPLEEATPESVTKLNAETIAQFDDHGGTVWRVCFNCTGTLFISSGYDGCVRMYQINQENEWKPVTVFPADASIVPTGVEAVSSTATAASQSQGAATTPAPTARYIKLGSFIQSGIEPWY